MVDLMAHIRILCTVLATVFAADYEGAKFMSICDSASDGDCHALATAIYLFTLTELLLG